MMPDTHEKPLVFLIGCGPTALTALRSLLVGCQLGGVLREPLLAGDPVQELALSAGVPLWSGGASAAVAEIIAKVQPDVVVISSFHRILSPEVLRLSRFVNVHYSPLPRYRGRANVNWALINGESMAAISIHRVDPGLDSGNLLYQQQIPIAPTDTAASLYERLNDIQERELSGAVLRLLRGDEGCPQDHVNATYGCARVPRDGEIEWQASTEGIDRLIRALAPPFPGAFTYCEARRWIISKAVPLRNAPVYVGRVPGRIVGRSAKEGWVDVLTGNGVLRLLEVLDDRGDAVLPAAVFGSTRLTLGLSVSDLLERIQALETRLSVLTTTMGAAESCFRSEVSQPGVACGS